MDAMHKSVKRGVSYSFTNLMDLAQLSSYISWDYNWGNTPTDDAAMWFDANEMDYCPMCWNGNYNADAIRAFVAAHPKTKYLLAFNEPNLTDQANMTPTQAAALWTPVVELAKELNLLLVSPAMNYGTLSGYSNPVKWLDEFFAQPNVSIEDIYAISVHCYMASASAVQGYIEMFEKYNKPIWLTEFCAWDPVPGSVETQISYMCNVLNYLEQHKSVERYAWFIPRTNKPIDTAPYMQLLTHDLSPELTTAGKIYAYFSSFDRDCYLNANRLIYAGEYVTLSNNATQLRPNTDATAKELANNREGLKVTNLSANQSLTYQVAVKEATSVIKLRYAGYSNCIMNVIVDGESVNYIDMPRTGDAELWQEAQTSANIKVGYHTIQLELVSGSVALSGFQLQ